MLIQGTAVSTYYGDRPVTTKLQFQSFIFTTAAAGTGSLGISLSFATVSNGLARFGSAFDEVRLLDAKITLIPLTASNGMTAFFFSEKALSGVSLTTQAQRTTRTIANSNGAGTNYVMRWKADGFQDLSWDSLALPVAGGYFYAFTDPAFGTPAAVTQLWHIQIEGNFQFRGIASQ